MTIEIHPAALQGTINFRRISELLDGVAMLRGSAAWTAQHEHAMRVWLTKYKRYLESAHVVPERCSPCNHGLYYDVQMVSIMRFLGLCALVLTLPLHAIPKSGMCTFMPMSFKARRLLSCSTVALCMPALRSPCCALR